MTGALKDFCCGGIQMKGRTESEIKKNKETD